jgi:hypothetical protein
MRVAHRGAPVRRSWPPLVTPSHPFATIDPLALYDAVQGKIVEDILSISSSLSHDGDGFCVIDNVAGAELCKIMRAEAVAFHDNGAMGQSYSEAADESGALQRFEKPGVFSLELNGNEVDKGSFLLHYTAAILHTIPQLINHHLDASLSSSNYGTKLAVTRGGAKYPKHVDNVGAPDHRKLTCIYYLNGDWEESNGAELRVWGNRGLVEDIAPLGDRLVFFWSDQIVHEVLSNTAELSASSDRYALTLWLVTEDPSSVCDPDHPLAKVKHEHFPLK